MDSVSLQRIDKLHPKLREQAKKILAECDQALTGRAKVRVTFTLRTFAEQQAIYNQGRTTKGPIVTNAKPGQSYHNFGMALDICLILDGKEVSWDTVKDFDGDKKSDWLEVVAIFVKYGWTWGADWDGDGITKAQGDKDESLVDAPHFQKTFGHGWRELLALHNAGKVDAQGYVLV